MLDNTTQSTSQWCRMDVKTGSKLGDSDARRIRPLGPLGNYSTCARGSAFPTKDGHGNSEAVLQ